MKTTSTILLEEYIRESLLREFVEGKCPSCGAAAPRSGVKFCVKCGTKLGVCPKCSTPLNDRPTQKFCTKCGEKLAKEDPASADSMAQKIQNMMNVQQSAWEAATKRSDASATLEAAHDKLMSAFNKLMRAYGQLGTDEAISAAKSEYASAKEAVAAAAAEDEVTFNALVSALEATPGFKVSKEFLDAQKNLSTTRRKTVSDADTNLDQMEKIRKDFDQKMKDASQWRGLAQLPQKITGNFEKDVKAFKKFLNSNPTAQAKNDMYLAYVIGFFRVSDFSIAEKLNDAFNKATESGRNFGKSGNNFFSDEVINSILDSAGEKAAAFKK